MIYDDDFSQLIQSINDKSLQLIQNFQANSDQISEIIEQFINLTEQYLQILSILFQNPQKLWEMHLAYWNEVYLLTQNHYQSWLNNTTSVPNNDSRFIGNEWMMNPVFNMISQHYLLVTQHINELFKKLEYDDKNLGKRLQFSIKYYLDALAPSNFLYTNPQLMNETIKSQGKNLLQGLHNFLTDLDKKSLKLNLKMTDNQAFKIGINLATTAGKVIFRNEMMELIQYSPKTEKVKYIPLLIIPPWINKYYILDLSPSNSLVRWTVEQGISVFIISWRNPDERFANKSLFDYLQEGPQTAITVIQNQLQVKQVNTLGFCIGGTLQTLLLAYNQFHDYHAIHSATFLASMIDFSDPGDIAVFIDEDQIQKLENEMKIKGYLAGKVMETSFNSLRANDLIWSFYIKNYLQGKSPVPFDILFWNSDSTNMPAKMHSQYLRWMYLHNNLIKANKIRLNHTPIDVRKIDLPTFFLSTEKDHIAPWKTTYKGYSLMKGPKRFVLGGSGHVAGIINPPGKDKYYYRINSSSDADSNIWYKNSVEHAGSWWPEWGKWLKMHSGKWVLAANINKGNYKPIMDAPGSYVLQKS